MHAVCCAVMLCMLVCSAVLWHYARYVQCFVSKQLLVSVAITATCCTEDTMDSQMLHCCTHMPYAYTCHKVCWAYLSSCQPFQLSVLQLA